MLKYENDEYVMFRRRTNWLQWVEKLVLAERPDLAGKVKIDQAIDLWNSGADTETAAQHLIASHGAKP